MQAEQSADLKVLATGLRFPEGPMAMPDGSVILVEIERQTLSRVTPDGKVHVIAALGGGPNGAAMGPGGKQAGALPTFRTSILQTYFSYAAAGNGLPAAVASGQRTRVTPAVFYYYKAFGVFAEYARSTQAVSRGGPSQDVTNQGWDVTGIYNLTGETATAGLVTPTRTFDPPTRKWGAMQIVARAAELRVDDTAFDAGFAAAGASRRAQQMTVGVNWYPLQYVKYYLNYERIVFDKNVPGARPIEHSIFLRVQLAF